jgi:hypothetical protein
MQVKAQLGLREVSSFLDEQYNEEVLSSRASELRTERGWGL